jgi:hypothetical protein
MFFRALTRLATMICLALAIASCGGGSPAPAATGLKASSGESSAIVSWDMVPGVEYWLFYAPTIVAPADTSDMSKWIITSSGGGAIVKVASPYTVSGLANGLGYSFTINGRTDGGPGGPAPAPVTATPRLAGTTWTAGQTATATDLRAVVFGTQYIAAGAGGLLISSSDNGATWTSIASPTSKNLNGATIYGDYRIVGDGGVLLSSTDAVTWTQQTTPTTQNLYAIANNGYSMNVAVGASGTIITSSDGTTWTAATSSGTAADLYSVTYTTYGAGLWVAVGANGTMVTSTDGLSWTAVTTGTTADLRGVTFGYTNTSTLATSFVVVGTGATVLTSTDAATWTNTTLPGASTLNAVRYGSQFVLVGAGGKAFTSTDAATWTASDPTGTTNDLLALTRGYLSYMAVGTAGTNLLAK